MLALVSVVWHNQPTYILNVFELIRPLISIYNLSNQMKWYLFFDRHHQHSNIYPSIYFAHMYNVGTCAIWTRLSCLNCTHWMSSCFFGTSSPQHICTYFSISFRQHAKLYLKILNNFLSLVGCPTWIFIRPTCLALFFPPPRIRRTNAKYLWA